MTNLVDAFSVPQCSRLETAHTAVTAVGVTIEEGDLVAFSSPQLPSVAIGKYYLVRHRDTLGFRFRNNDGNPVEILDPEFKAWGCSKLSPSRNEGHELDIG